MVHTKKYSIFFLLLFSIPKVIANGIPILGDLLTQNGQEQRFSRGELLISQKNKLQVEENLFHQDFQRGSETIIRTVISYGLTNRFGLEVSIPITLKEKTDGDVLRGIQDTFVLGQYTYPLGPYNLLVFNAGFTIPSGTPDFDENVFVLGSGGIDFVFEFAQIHSSEKWYADQQFSAVYTRKHNNRKLGSIFRYIFTLGQKFPLKCLDDRSLLITNQFIGFFEQQDRINGKRNPNSGESALFMGPLISLRTERFLWEVQFNVPLFQYLKGNQPKTNYRAELTVQITF